MIALTAEDYSRLHTHYTGGFAGFRDLCADQFMIVPKEGAGQVPLVLNRHQLHVLSEMEKQWDKRRLTRLMILKSRRVGMSTLSCSWVFANTALLANINSRIIAQNDDTTQQLWRFISGFKDSTDINLIPRATQDSTHALGWHGTGSSLSLATAGARTGGRGGTYQNLLLSEAAFYPRTFRWRANWLPTVATMPGTTIIIESTAYGKAGDFHMMWNAAVDGSLDYTPVFLPWHWSLDNRVSEREFDARFSGFNMTPAELELSKRFGLDKYQLAWRRDEMVRLEQESQDGGDPFALFCQEHPSTPDESFLFSGNPVFDQAKLGEAEKAQRRPIGRFEIDADKGRLIPADRGRLRLWETPNPDRRYCVGADVAEGLTKGDNSSAYTVDMVTGKTVAAWVANDADPDMFGRYLFQLGNLYGQAKPGISRRRAAVICVERNGPGMETVRTLLKMHYPFVWQTEDPSHFEGDKQKPHGFRTTVVSKQFLIAQLRADLRDDPAAMVDPELISEMGTFVRVPNDARPDKPGRMEASPGHKDDRVIARALASMVYRSETGKSLITAEEKEGVKRAAEAKASIDYGRSLYRGWDKQKSSTPGWKPNEKARAVTVKHTVDDLNEVLAGLEAEVAKRRAVVVDGAVVEITDEGGEE